MLKFLKPFSFIPALLMMYMIFSFSSQDGITSSQLSYKVSYKIVETGGKLLGEELEPWEIDSIATRFHGIVRKLAHMGEYFLLAIAVSFPLYVYGLRGFLLMIVAGMFCVAFACGDEYHQSYIDGRSPSPRDVLIDSFGVFWGIILVRIVGWTGRKTIFRPFGKKKKSQKAAYQQAACPGPQYTYGAAPTGGGQFYGNIPSGEPQPYTGAPAGAQPYGNAAAGGPIPYGNGSAGVPSSYGNGPVGAPPSYGNSPAGASQPYGSGSAGASPSYGNGPADLAQSYGNGSAGPAQPFGNTPPQYGVPPYGGPQPGYPQQPAYGSPQYVTPPVYQGQGHPDDATSDKLSEDLSLKKLMRDLKDQKKEHKEQKREAKKSRAVREPGDADDLEINEIDLDDRMNF